MSQFWNVILLLIVQIRPECKGATTGGREVGRLEGPGTPNILSTPNFGQSFQSGGRFNSFVLNVSLRVLWKVDFLRFPILIYTRLNDLKFEIPKIVLGRGSPSPLPGTPTLSRAWARERVEGLKDRGKILPRFGLRPQISSASCPRFELHPIRIFPTFEAWLRPCPNWSF